METPNRRTFLASAAVAAAFANPARAIEPDVVTLGIIGSGGRGNELLRAFGKVKTRIVFVADPDVARREKLADASAKELKQETKAVNDFRTMLDSKDVQAVVVATPNHWHAPAAILGCSAGKHVYVEKPCSFDPNEGELLVAAARKNKRHVQMGNQRRSFDVYMEAVKLLKAGEIGRTYLAKSWYFNNRPTIGAAKPGDVPKGLDYALWQGPAPAKPFQPNFLHYNWHWFWNWGNGELGNNGIHSIDVCRWGLGVEYPIRVSSTGGRYQFADDQETPDTNNVTYDFPDRKTITWEGISCMTAPGYSGYEIVFYGDKGTMAVRDNLIKICNPKGAEVKRIEKAGNLGMHLNNFLSAVMSDQPLNSEIEEGHKSTLLCHLGNISYRTGRTLNIDPKTGKIVNDKEASAFWSREYAKGFEPKV
ncbi:Gfo/Idh/MocA family protein [Zavarzinella formosa]|uniref:Gfo/Idh/MocA family protein n=1 Tax=Zavarzinella formosa TaxID=360055 RepID=UPI00037149C2|nr:Gfo/Idh/MocA family oxidoreductase [Zavarzinella formosa]